MSSDATPRLGLPDMPETPELYPDIVADAFTRLDALCDLYLKGQFEDSPPVSPADGDAWLIGGSPTGAWAGYPYKIATCRDGAWIFLTPFNGLRAFVETGNAFIVHQDGSWIDWGQLLRLGTGSDDDAATGEIGEFLESEIADSAAVALTSGVTSNITSLTLAAGDWDVSGMVCFRPAVPTTISSMVGAFSTSSAVYPGHPNKGAAIRLQYPAGFTPNDDAVLGGLRRRYSLAAPLTVYMVAVAYFSGGTLSGFGHMAARRVR